MAVTAEVAPIGCWAFPGSTADSAIIRRVKDDLTDWNLHRLVGVADRGLASAANRGCLTRGGGHNIHAENCAERTSRRRCLRRTASGQLRVDRGASRGRRTSTASRARSGCARCSTIARTASEPTSSCAGSPCCCSRRARTPPPAPRKVAGQKLTAGKSIWLVPGLDPLQLVDDSPAVDAKKVAAAVDKLLAHAPQLAQRVPDFDGGARPPTVRAGASWHRLLSDS